jgi:hypothetical protein
MHPRILAEREQAAQGRIEAAAMALGGNAETIAPFDRDPQTRVLLRLEAVADLLERVVQETEERQRKRADEAHSRKEAEGMLSQKGPKR